MLNDPSTTLVYQSERIRPHRLHSLLDSPPTFLLVLGGVILRLGGAGRGARRSRIKGTAGIDKTRITSSPCRGRMHPRPLASSDLRSRCTDAAALI
ncbi:hypothetical protein DFH06DRAFT_1292925 [Mycena polygramma]|nr:hypothetical protein DFH06DRAFT_1292925 [Mycena polygramma]